MAAVIAASTARGLGGPNAARFRSDISLHATGGEKAAGQTWSGDEPELGLVLGLERLAQCALAQ
jgi:hypothetical protein